MDIATPFNKIEEIFDRKMKVMAMKRDFENSADALKTDFENSANALKMDLKAGIEDIK